jgi:hypothetical protein
MRNVNKHDILKKMRAPQARAGVIPYRLPVGVSALGREKIYKSAHTVQNYMKMTSQPLAGALNCSSGIPLPLPNLSRRQKKLSAQKV